MNRMIIEPAKPEHLIQLMEWFSDARSCQMWGGMQFRYPFTSSSFEEDSRWQTLPSYVLLDDAEALLGFGQFYLRAGRCHLGRLVISPAHRAKGLGGWLIGGLTQLGTKTLNATECSLFVVKDNAPAIRLYEKLGFVRASYPEHDPDVAPFDYMVVSAAKLIAWNPQSRRS